ncbi:glycerate kinase [Micromonospora deserti]|uniref:Glycerate kinase n=1 Tax=Micromonospora deserti TaxID=2070366 RepID=A0A2W2CVF4_9ACTN|nr:glycerate kinase [Micromonospora deserti]PZG01871.1 glycerate kinase [Micromonospora deserti]
MDHVLLAPDKFKGSLTAAQVVRHLAAGLRRARPRVEIRGFPIADGGDGTLDAAVSAGFRRVPVVATGPTGAPVLTAYAERDGVAVVELADACGQRRLPGGVARPLDASSWGVGEVIRAALDHGCREIVLGLGGSASTDGGAGLLGALGVRLLDERGAVLPPGGAALRRLRRIDLADLHPAVERARFVVAGDVDNPLLGPAGAAAVYGPQKGASGAHIAILEAGLIRWSETVAVELGEWGVVEEPGAGAAGGVGFAALAFLGAEFRPGIELLLDLLAFADQLEGAGLVVTGEGSLDAQSLHGKAPIGVATAAGRAGVPAVAVAGQVGIGPDELRDAGIHAAYPLTDLEPSVETCRLRAPRLVEEIAELLAADWLDPAGRPHAYQHG